MSEKNPLEPLLDQISDILNLFEQNRETQLKGNPSAQNIADLMNVMARVDAMKQAYEEAKKATGLTEEDINKAMRDKSDHVDPKYQKLLSKIDRMRKEASFNSKMIGHTIEAERRKKVESSNLFKTKKKRKQKSQKSLSISFRKGWKKM